MTKRRYAYLLSLILVSALSSSCRTEPAAGADSARDVEVARLPVGLLGCYALFDSTGRPADELLFMVPNGTRLEVVSTRRGSLGVAWRLNDQGATLGGPSAATDGLGPGQWRADPRVDTLRLVFSPGMGGTEFVLAFDGRADTLRGRAIRHRDWGPPFETDEGAAMAVRRSCRERPG